MIGMTNEPRFVLRLPVNTAGTDYFVGDIHGEFDVLEARLKTRKGHFFPASLLQSQLDSLEEPDESEAMIIDAARTPDAILDILAARLEI